MDARAQGRRPSLWLRPRLAASLPMTGGRRSSCTTISPSPRMSFMLPRPQTSKSCCFSAPPASTRKWPPQPIEESALLTGPLEPTNEWYAIAKIAGLKLCQAYRREYGCDFIAAMPTNLYGPGDNFDLTTSHVIPALMRKAHEAKIAAMRRIRDLGLGHPEARIPACRRRRRRARPPHDPLLREHRKSMLAPEATSPFLSSPS